MEQRAVNKIFKFNQMWLSCNNNFMLGLIYKALKPFEEELEKEIQNSGGILKLKDIIDKTGMYKTHRYQEYLYSSIKSLYIRDIEFRRAFDELVD